MTSDSRPARALRLAPDGRLADRGFLTDPALALLFEALAAGNEEARVVGGAVRNTLLGLGVADVDVATTALPRTVMRLASARQLRTIPTGIAHGTVTVQVEGRGFEVTTLRDDVETDGRHAVVRFSRDFVADAQRRDFTINALSVTLDGTIHDTTGGVADLAAGRVRFIGAAEQRIREDVLRILRFFRFHASYGLGPLDPDGLAAATRHRDLLATLSRERVRAELLKLIGAPGAAAVVAVMAEAGILDRILEGPGRPDRLARLVGFEARRGAAPDALLRLAALMPAGFDALIRLRSALRLSNEEQRRLAEAIAAGRHLDPRRPPDVSALRALLFACGPQAARDGVQLAAADADPAEEPAWEGVLRAMNETPVPRLPVGGAEVLARGVASGRSVGAILKRLQANWIRAGFPDHPTDLARLLDEAIAAETADGS